MLHSRPNWLEAKCLRKGEETCLLVFFGKRSSVIFFPYLPAVVGGWNSDPGSHLLEWEGTRSYTRPKAQNDVGGMEMMMLSPLAGNG